MGMSNNKESGLNVLGDIGFDFVVAGYPVDVFSPTSLLD